MLLAWPTGLYAFKPADTDTIVCDSSISSPQGAWEGALKESLASLALEAQKKYYTTAFAVYDLTDDTLIYQYNADKVLRPASTQKLLTTIAALDLLGPDHLLKTTASYTGTINTFSTPHQSDSTFSSPMGGGREGALGSYLNGSIIIRGEMDVAYSYGELVNLAREIQALGIDSISGSIYADISFKDSALLGAGWCWDDEPSVFSPYLSPLMFDRGKLTPDSDTYPKNQPLYHPAEHFVEILKRLISSPLPTSPPGGGADSIIHRGIKLAQPINNTTSPHNSPVSTNPSPLGGGREGASPVLFYSNSRRLEQFLNRTLKNSDNLYAEAIFSHICHFNTGDNCKAKDGARLIYNVLRKAEADMPHPMPGASDRFCEIADGCGLSLYNYHTAALQIALLRYAYRHENIFRYLYPSLAIAGRDGSISSRMKRTSAADNIHAKTGTLSGVSALSGYATASNGHLLCFAIISNGLLRTSTAHSFQDRLCIELTKTLSSPSSPPPLP